MDNNRETGRELNLRRGNLKMIKVKKKIRTVKD